jgi:hypothetical protein
MIGVVGDARRSVERVRDWIIEEILQRQKPELDRKVDEMLKPKVKRLMVRYLGIGKGLGKKIGTIGKGLKIGGALRRLL